MASSELKSWNAKLRYKCNKESAADARETLFYDHQLKFLGLLIDDDRRRALESAARSDYANPLKFQPNHVIDKNILGFCKPYRWLLEYMCDRISKSGDRCCDQQIFGQVIDLSKPKVFQV